VIELKVKSVVDKGEKKVKILDMKALREDELPDRYMGGYPRCYLNNSIGKVMNVYFDEEQYMFLKRFYGDSEHVSFAENNICFVKGEKFEINFFNELVAIIEQCGKRLKQINEQIKEETKNWHGEQTIKI
jgi:hypothetical protein